MAPLRSLEALLNRAPTPAAELNPQSFSPLELEDKLKTRDIGSSPTYNPGHGVTNPNDFDNVGFFVLFAIIGAAFVLASIWFFFWAKNGGFHFKKGDWSEYKSTVLRRKGPDGKTLSNATKSTKLGGGSVVGSEYTDVTRTTRYTDSEKGEQEPPPAREETQRKKKKRHHKLYNKHDADVRAYREEKSARVGGLNKEAEGTVHDYSTAPSNASDAQPAAPERSRPERYHNRSSHQKGSPHREFSYNRGSEASFSVVSDVSSSSQAPLAAPKPSAANAGRHKQQYQTNRERRSHGFYAARASEGSYVDPINFHGSHSASNAPSVAQIENTKAYKHVIPGLRKGPAGPSSGFRRGGAGREDSLNDSDSE